MCCTEDQTNIHTADYVQYSIASKRRLLSCARMRQLDGCKVHQIGHQALLTVHRMQTMHRMQQTSRQSLSRHKCAFYTIPSMLTPLAHRRRSFLSSSTAIPPMKTPTFSSGPGACSTMLCITSALCRAISRVGASIKACTASCLRTGRAAGIEY